ncbi:MAG: ATP synthase F1 subunit epsilon [Alphaproteobacteria bacterium]|nr:ATP synthase F1 subunit epsilon [Alphaproteobacteria bacterium]
MAETFNFELVSPEALQVSKPVKMVSVPGSMGEYSVMAGHAPIITELKPGVIRIYADNEVDVTESLFVAGGFAEVTQTRFTVLAGEAIPVSKLDRAALKAESKDLYAKIDTAISDSDRELLQKQWAVLEAKLQAAA